MKKLLGLGLALLCLTACSDDDSAKPAVDTAKLTQKWYYVSTKIGGQTIPYDGNEACGKDYMEFLTANVVKDVDVYDCQQDPDVTTGSYTVADKTLTTVLDGETIVYTMKKLDAKNLQLATTFNGATITYVFTSTP